jgi:hypothetical protein
MTDGTLPHRLAGHLRELAEGLQAAAGYLGAARIRSLSPSEHALSADIIDKAKAEIARAQAAFHRLRDCLGSDIKDKNARNTLDSKEHQSDVGEIREITPLIDADHEEVRKADRSII